MKSARVDDDRSAEDQKAARSSSVDIQLIGHACILITFGDIRLLCDPWLTGTAFLDGWGHLVDPTETIESINPTHIWISHEHPDHFSPRDLLAVEASKRSKIQVLYQATKDRKVVSFLELKGYSVTELKGDEPHAIGPELSVVCGQVGADSWLLVNAGKTQILNLNDCITGQDIMVSNPDDLPSEVLDEIAKFCTSPDVLLTQFSYSNWVGNPDDFELHRRQAETKLNQVRQQLRYLKPKSVVPFASFIWFCHEENAHQNACMNSLDHVVPVIAEEGADAVVLYPNDRWTVNTPMDNSEAQARWRRIYSSIDSRKPIVAQPVPLETLQALFEAYRKRIVERNDWSAIVDLKRRGWLPPAQLFVQDHQLSVSFDLVDGLMPSPVLKSQCDIHLGSTSLAYLLKHDWGRGTLMVNARFTADYQGIHRFLAQTQIAYANNVGLTYPATLDESVIRESPSYVAFFARQAIKMKRETHRDKTSPGGSKANV